MLRHIIAICIFLIISISGYGKVRFAMGLEFSGAMNVHAKGYCLYLAPDHFLAEDNIDETMLQFNGSICAHAGISLSRARITAYTGYRGYYLKNQHIPLGIKAMIFTKKNSGFGSFVYIDESYGLTTKNKKNNSYSASLGYGYRFRLTDRLGIAYHVGLNYCYAKPDRFVDQNSGAIIGNNDIRDIHMNVIGLNFGMSVGF